MMKDIRKAADIKHNDLKEYLITTPLTLSKGYWKGKKDASGCYWFFNILVKVLSLLAHI